MEQIEDLKGLLIAYKENDFYGVSRKLVGELIDSLIVIKVVERKIDDIIFNARKRIN